MNADRRRQPRKVPQSFTFLQLERDEGGHVINLSEEGLCFESFSPVRTANPVPLWFSFDMRGRVEATGQVVWMDPKKEVGGLAFINLSPYARQQIRSHFSDTLSEEPVATAARDGEEEARVASAHPSKRANLFVLPRIGKARSRENGASKVLTLGLTLRQASTSADQAPLAPLERSVSASHLQFLRGLLAGILISAVIAISVFRYALHSSANGVEREMSGPSSSGNAGGESDRGAKSASAPASPPPNSSANPSNNTAAAANVSSKDPAPKPNSLTLDQLWDAVQSGNAEAAVALADLYLRGDGVPVNCAQARVLLQFAAQKNNAEAVKKARELDKSGCSTP